MWKRLKNFRSYVFLILKCLVTILKQYLPWRRYFCIKFQITVQKNHPKGKPRYTYIYKLTAWSNFFIKAQLHIFGATIFELGIWDAKPTWIHLWSTWTKIVPWKVSWTSFLKRKLSVIIARKEKLKEVLQNKTHCFHINSVSARIIANTPMTSLPHANWQLEASNPFIHNWMFNTPAQIIIVDTHQKPGKRKSSRSRLKSNPE